MFIKKDQLKEAQMTTIGGLASSSNIANWYRSFSLFDHLFQFIKWEDEEPYNIQELLDN